MTSDRALYKKPNELNSSKFKFLKKIEKRFTFLDIERMTSDRALYNKPNVARYHLM